MQERRGYTFSPSEGLSPREPSDNPPDKKYQGTKAEAGNPRSYSVRQEPAGRIRLAFPVAPKYSLIKNNEGGERAGPIIEFPISIYLCKGPGIPLPFSPAIEPPTHPPPLNSPLMAYPRKRRRSGFFAADRDGNESTGTDVPVTPSSRKRFVENVRFFGHGGYIYTHIHTCTGIWKFRAGFAIFRPLNGKVEEVEGSTKGKGRSHIYFSSSR